MKNASDFNGSSLEEHLSFVKTILGNKYSERTLDYLKKHKKLERSIRGEFFTSYAIIYDLLRNSVPHLEGKDINVLEPSSGTGQFLDVLKYFFDDIDFCEISLGKDFLLYDTEKRYSLIIGNPPFSENCAGYSSKLKKFRYNMYALFVEKAITLLKDNGVLCFIIPPAILSAPSFDLLRKYMGSCGVRLVFRKDINKFSNEIGQLTSICIWKKFTNVIEEVRSRFTEKVTLGDVAIVKIGQVIWNQHKEQLSDVWEKDTKMIIYSSDISIFPRLKVFKNTLKKRFIRIDKPSLSLPVILMGRTKIPKFIIIKQGDYPLIAENHVNCIFPKEGVDINFIYEKLRSDKTKEYCIKNSGTSNFSKAQTELIQI